MNFYAISALINALTSFALGCVVLLKNRRQKSNYLFSFFVFAISFWSVGYFFWQIADTAKGALFCVRIYMASAIFVSFFYFHFALAFLGKDKKRRKSIIFAYLIASIFFLINFTPYFVSGVSSKLSFNFWPDPGVAFYSFLIIWFFYAIYATTILYKGFKVETGIKKSQLRYILLGMFIGFGGASTNYFLWFNVPIQPIGNILVSVSVVVMTYAIIRYRLMDIRIAIRKAFVYSGLATFAYGVFYLVAFAYQKIWGDIFYTQGYFVSVGIAFVFALSYPWAQKKIQNFANKWLYAGIYNAQTTLKELSKKLSEIIEMDELVMLIVKTIMKTLGLSKTGIILKKNKKSDKYEIAKVVGFDETNGISLVGDSFLTDWLKKNKRPLVYGELDLIIRDAKEIKKKEGFGQIKKHMEKIEAEICLPLIVRKELIGIIVLGEKINNEAYSEGDVELLKTVSSQASVAIENARSYDEIQNMNENLQDLVGDQTKDLKEKEQHLQELLNMKTDFLRVVNHQLNTPLSIMKGSFSMMDEKSWTTKKALGAIRSGFNRVSETVSDFWDAYELEGERMKMNPEQVSIASIVESLISEKEKMQVVSERKLKISFKKPKFEVPVVWCDLKKITHVVSNLLDNAIFYTRKGSVEASLSLEDDDYLKLVVKDTGAGISEEGMEKLFRKFSRGSKASGLNPNGSGLGLYIAKKIVEGNGGEISVSSKGEGEGSTFSFTLPIYKAQCVDSIHEQQPLRREKIVIFD